MAKLTKASTTKKLKVFDTKFIIIIIAIITLSLSIVAGIFYINNGKVVATINGSAVTLEQANLRMQMIAGDEIKNNPDLTYADLTNETKIAVIKEEAIHRILVERAKKENVISRKELVKEVANFKENLLKKKLLERIANSSITEEKLKEEYKIEYLLLLK